MHANEFRVYSHFDMIRFYDVLFKIISYLAVDNICECVDSVSEDNKT